MLARPDAYRCIECGLPYRAPGFNYYHGMMEEGPAYWTDRGLLCSAQCSIAHHKKRAAEGTLPQEPAPDPFEGPPLFDAETPGSVLKALP